MRYDKSGSSTDKYVSTGYLTERLSVAVTFGTETDLICVCCVVSGAQLVTVVTERSGVEQGSHQHCVTVVVLVTENSQAGKQTDRQANIQTDRHTGKQTAGRQTKTDRPKDKHTNRPTYLRCPS